MTERLTCFDEHATPFWLSDAQLRDETPAVNLTLAPVYLTGITDAIDVALSGRPSLCVARRGGTVACLDDDGELKP